MNKTFKWRKMKLNDIPAIEKLLYDNEIKYVNACGRFLARNNNDPVFVLCGKKDKISALLINSKSTLLPVFCGINEIPVSGLLNSFLKKKRIHSVQGLSDEVSIMEDIMKKAGLSSIDIFEYNLMSLDSNLNISNNEIPGLSLKVPGLIDLDAMAPLQAAYELEEVIPKGSSLNPAASRINTSNIIANGLVLAAQKDGKLVGKINVNAISFTRFQVGGVYVHPDYRKMGIARKMTEEFIASLLKQGKAVTLFVKKTNIAAYSLYSSLGFTVNGNYSIIYY